MYKILLILLSAIWLFYSPVLAVSEGTSGAQFLKIGVGTRNIAMGETGAASSGLNSLYWNPAGLALLNARSISFTYSPWLETMNNSHLLCALPTKIGSFGITLNYRGMDPMDRYDNTGLQTGNFNASETVISLSYARRLLNPVEQSSELLMGVSAKQITSKIENEQANAAAFDAGLQLILPNISFGLAVQNMGTGIKFIETSDPLPLNVKFGALYKLCVRKLDTMLIACDLNMPNDARARVNLGAEYQCSATKDISVSPRLGFKSNTTGLTGLASVTAGVGISLDSYSINYAFVPYGDLGNTSQLSLEIRF